MSDSAIGMNFHHEGARQHVCIDYRMHDGLSENCNQHREPREGDDPIPRYAQLDIWMALGYDPNDYTTHREAAGFDATWAVLCAAVRSRRG